MSLTKCVAIKLLSGSAASEESLAASRNYAKFNYSLIIYELPQIILSNLIFFANSSPWFKLNFKFRLKVNFKVKFESKFNFKLKLDFNLWEAWQQKNHQFMIKLFEFKILFLRTILANLILKEHFTSIIIFMFVLKAQSTY